jgi:hypothetical protein
MPAWIIGPPFAAISASIDGGSDYYGGLRKPGKPVLKSLGIARHKVEVLGPIGAS